MIAAHLYRLLLRLAPADLRERHGDAMCDLLEQEIDDARARGTSAAFLASARGIADLAARIPYEHARRMRRRPHHPEHRMSRFLEVLRLDLRFALRSLRRRPTFAVVTIATLAISIGAATAIFGVVDGVLFRSLPFRESARIVSIWQTDSTRLKQAVLASNWDRVPLDYTDYLRWRERQQSFDGVGVWSGFGAIVQGDAAPEQINGTRVSPGLFELLGVAPVLGRPFLPGEDVVGGPRVTMLSFETWQRRFGGQRNVIGQTVLFDDEPYRIVGVLPEGFTLQRGKPGAPFWVPAGQEVGDVGKYNRSFRGIGRLKAGVPVEQAMTETRQLLDGDSPPARHGVRIERFVRDETRDVRAPLLILLGAVGVLLLIACVNVATLLLGEAATRDVEMSARIALGASRGRIVRQLLTESLLLSLAGGVAGAMLAWWGTKAIVALAPANIPGLAAIRVDSRVLVAALAAAAVAGILFGLAPALLLSEAGPAALLRSTRGSRDRGRLQRTMIAVELALSVILLVGAGLLGRSLRELSAVRPGFRTDHLAVVRLSWGKPYADTVRLHAFYDDVMTRLAATPGVEAVTSGSSIPFTGGSSSSPYLLSGEGDAERRAHKHEVQQRVIAPNYFAVMGIPVVAGRAFSGGDRDRSEPVAIISEAAARRDFPGISPVGQRVHYQGTWRTIVGVVRDTKYARLSAADQPAIYTPFRQRNSVMDVVVRTTRDPAALAGTIRRLVQGDARDLAVTDVQIMDPLIARSFAEERFRTALIVLFGAIAAALAAVGLFGVTARAVSRRTREVGIRVALGATTPSVIAMIMRQTLRSVAVGVTTGTAIAVMASRILSPYLYGVRPSDPATYGAIVMLLIATSILASWLPARRAGRVPPAVVLRDG